WGGEFGRLPTIERVTARPGRDHNPHGFSIWMAGGGLKAGFDFGDTDELGYAAVGEKLTHSDVHATVLHLLGLDFKRLTFDYEGRGNSHAVSLVNFADGKVIREFKIPGMNGPSGLTIDGTDTMWIDSSDNSMIFKVDHRKGELLAKYWAPGASRSFRMKGDPEP